MALDIDENSSDAHEMVALFAKKMPPVVSKTNLAVLFGYSPRFIGAIIKNPNRYYRRFSIPKGNRRRYIDAPKVSLKVIQSWFGYHLARAIFLPKCAVGFVPGISSIDGAAMHCGSAWVFSTDIVDFFQTTSENKVKESLLKAGYSINASNVMASLSCLNGYLAQGSPCSPVLSNLVALELDEIIQNYVDKYGLVYTRYADDIVISGCGHPPDGMQEFVLSSIRSQGWQVSDKKTNIATGHKRLKVYGLLVNGEKPRLTKGYRNRIRALSHLKERGKLDPERTYQALGHLAYSRSVDEWEDKSLTD